MSNYQIKNKLFRGKLDEIDKEIENWLSDNNIVTIINGNITPLHRNMDQNNHYAVIIFYREGVESPTKKEIKKQISNEIDKEWKPTINTEKKIDIRKNEKSLFEQLKNVFNK